MDRVEIRLLPGSVRDNAGRTFSEVVSLERAIPPQINSITEETVATSAETVSGRLQKVTVGYVVVNFALSASLNYLWSMIEA